MRPLGRRSLFALLPVAPVAVVAAVKAPTPPLIDNGPMKTFNELAASLQEWKPFTFDAEAWGRATNRLAEEMAEMGARMRPSPGNLAATLGIPYEQPHVWTDDDVALTLGIDVQRDVIAISAMAVPA